MGKLSEKLIVYSGHDSTISPILSTLKLTSVECMLERFLNGKEYLKECPGHPPFSSNLIFELLSTKSG